MSRTAWNAVDLSGVRFGRLVAVKRGERSKCGASMWVCKCDCGKEVCAQYSNLKSGATQSCGCLNADNLVRRNYKHGGDRRNRVERLYRVWRGMIGRCEDPRNNSFQHYGKQGVSVCGEWKDYSNFRRWAIASGYDEFAPRGNCTIDRIDPCGNYEPSNCRWTSMAVQNHNRRADHE